MRRTIARSKMIAIAAEVPETRRAKREPWRIVAPPKRTVENPIVRNKRIGVKSGVPIPASIGPNARETSHHRRHIFSPHLRWRRPSRRNAGWPSDRSYPHTLCDRISAPFAPLAVLRLNCVRPSLLTWLAVGLNHGFSIEHADLAVVRVDVVQARLE